MSGIGTGYDLSSTTFSPDGRVFQIEYAHKAVENSGNALGVSCKDGVVIALEKIVLSKMLVPGTTKRVHIIDRHVCLGISGLISDGRQLVTRAREECAQYKDIYGSPIPGHVLADRIANFVHLYTLYWHVRPFGCSILLGVCGEDSEGKMTPQLYMIEPSGVCYRYFGAATGKARQAAKTELEKLDFKSLTCKEAVKELAKIIVQVHDDTKDKTYELEMIWNCEETKYQTQLVPQDVITEAHDLAKQANKSDDDDDDDEMEEQ